MRLARDQIESWFRRTQKPLQSAHPGACEHAFGGDRRAQAARAAEHDEWGQPYDNVNDISSSALGNLGADVRWRLEFE